MDRFESNCFREKKSNKFPRQQCTPINERSTGKIFRPLTVQCGLPVTNSDSCEHYKESKVKVRNTDGMIMILTDGKHIQERIGFK